MKSGGFSQHLLAAARGLVYLAAFLTPLFFLPWTIDPLEINKQTLFILVTLLGVLCWFGAMVLEKKFSFQKGWINALPLLLVGAFLVPAVYSISPYTSWVGANSQQYTSVLTMAAGALLFYLVVNLFTDRKHHQWMHALLLGVSVLVGAMGLLSFYGWDALPVMNVIGTPNSLAIFLSAATSLSIAAWVSHKQGDSLLHDGILGTLEQALVFVLALITFLVVLIIDFSLTWIVFLSGLLFVFLFVLFRLSSFPSLKRLWLPGLLIVVSLPFWFWMSSPLHVSLPLEVSLNHEASMHISEQALEQYGSSYGSGPGSYAFLYNQFHTSQINATDLWNARFDRASSFAMTLLPTIGVVGVVSLSAFILLLFLRGLKQVLRPKTKEQWLESFVHLAPWMTLLVSALLFPWNMSITVLFLLLSGLIGAQLVTPRPISANKFPGIALIGSAIFLTSVLLFLVGVFATTQVYTAEVAFANAVELDREGGDLQEIITSLDRAATLNRFSDVYYRTLAEALLLRVGEQIELVTSADTLTPESESYVQSLIAAAVSAAITSTDLSPHNVNNWLTRGLVYRELVPVQATADAFALEAYMRATELEPNNPSRWTELGKTYLVAAAAHEPLTAAQDADQAAEASLLVEQYLQGAEASFHSAIELKSNYAPAHFQLGVTYQRQGRIDDAIGKLESVATYNQLDVGVHFELGILYLQRGGSEDIERAQEVLERAVALAPSYANARWYLATVYEIQDEITEAIGQIEAILLTDPENTLVRTRLDRLLRGELSEEVPEAIEEQTE